MSAKIYRAQTIGSMLRPAWLRDARRGPRRGESSTTEFKRVEDRAVDEALAMQERAGVDVMTDGEQRRASFVGSLIDTTVGLSRDLSLTKPWHEADDSVTELSLGLVV